ncbi:MULTISPECIES: 1,4-alpha-glucan branching protein GlgB [Dethiosulfovibrio]|uniref:1,4-alpha-glucan branching enzyme GlgB n=2 Tax=Dethiosulfovibrio TaxID=47054 RepID=A0ABS9ER49_9BACT|nr:MULTISPECIES: 1,4-alpha-glucan branching protein GlgB [Dethiosulfovibrio]MCF4115177.1 1,4-alpha-glucan branching protein GlgB [Dethiosulfovibrio russensis]MCF4143640.1 1,4-alpha-glucan branching protein GlgB [Dethiosulfovibrio marinus]MCF4146088.1 1,4-alpha-glucan branching protein GlgB [Dethiosulfovibrio acidaminovorans]
MADSRLSDYDVFLFRQGRHYRLYERLGSFPKEGGTSFALWAPNAREVSVLCDSNGWTPGIAPLYLREDGSGIWEGTVSGISIGDLYKYGIKTGSGEWLQKGDPMACRWETPPRSASMVWNVDYEWSDRKWMENRGERLPLDGPWSVYEVHLGSWKRRDGSFLSYREIAPLLADHVLQAGFTAVELLPVMEHPFYGSWGYQVLGYFAPSGRYGLPEDFMYLVDYLHSRGVAVILDWVPSHFPSDAYGLARFDGTALYEHPDSRRGYHPQWTSCIFNYGRHEVRSFLISSAAFWLDMYHADGLRVDGVASMLYLDYCRERGEWEPNRYGGRENLEAVSFLRELNSEISRGFPDVVTVAEESTDWPRVTGPAHLGGLGFSMKWDMGWMHDTLSYFSRDPIHRPWHHEEITFGLWYAFSERFVLPVSHDEVVYGKRSLLSKMPGDQWRKKANLRLLFALMFVHPGKKLLFMGCEIGQWREWDHEVELDWALLDDPSHRGILRLVSDLNRLYREEEALHRDFDPDGFRWIDCSDRGQSVFAMMRPSGSRSVVGVFNCTPIPRTGYRIGLPSGGRWLELCNTDSNDYGGSGVGNLGGVSAEEVACHGLSFSVEIVLPPLGAVILAPETSLSDGRE